jgi:hypothetical protein
MCIGLSVEYDADGGPYFASNPGSRNQRPDDPTMWSRLQPVTAPPPQERKGCARCSFSIIATATTRSSGRSSRLVADKLLALRHGVATSRLRSAIAHSKLSRGAARLTRAWC